MKVIPLTQGKVALVDNDDFERLNRFKWCAHKHKEKRKVLYYAVRNTPRINGKSETVLMHREILELTDTATKSDHKDGDTLNNQKENLRIATNRQNAQNAMKSSGFASRYKGVTWHNQRNKWWARIHVNGQQQSLGLFEDEKNAATAYSRAANLHFGKFAQTVCVVS